MQRFTLTRRDGASLAGYRSGESGPVLVLANGLGGPVTAFRHQIARFEQTCRVLTWDYRGLYASRGSAAPDRVDVSAHADDLEDLLDHAGIKEAALVGWSMGVQVTLEFARRAPERVSHLVLINGAHGKPMQKLRVPFVGRWLPDLVERARAHHALGARLFRHASRSHTAAELARRLHIVSPRLGTDEILGLAREFTELDFDVYLRTLGALERHDASPILADVRARTLVIAGGRDPLFSTRQAEALTRGIARAELCVVPKATHYAPLEFPDQVNARIERFLGDSLAIAPNRASTEPD